MFVDVRGAFVRARVCVYCVYAGDSFFLLGVLGLVFDVVGFVLVGSLLVLVGVVL